MKKTNFWISPAILVNVTVQILLPGLFSASRFAEGGERVADAPPAQECCGAGGNGGSKTLFNKQSSDVYHILNSIFTYTILTVR